MAELAPVTAERLAQRRGEYGFDAPYVPSCLATDEAMRLLTPDSRLMIADIRGMANVRLRNRRWCF